MMAGSLNMFYGLMVLKRLLVEAFVLKPIEVPQTPPKNGTRDF